MTKFILKITPVGGVGKIGQNMTLVQTPQQNILIDSGILFPQNNCFNLNYLIPDLSSLPQVSNLIITHGHQDHIGAIGHLLEHFPEVKIHAPAFAAALIRKKLDQTRPKHLGSKNIHIYNQHTSFSFGDLNINPIFVNHSIPDTFGLLIQDKARQISTFFVSDFKYDERSPYEEVMDLKKLQRLTESSTKKVLFADSTNITSNNLKTHSEADLINPLEDIFKSSLKNPKTRIFTTLFASNIHRLQTFIDLAAKYKKKVVAYGNAIVGNIELAVQTGHLKIPKNLLKSSKAVGPDDTQLVVLVSGCQGDFRSALRRIASMLDSTFRPNENDLFIFSSQVIPGNENNVSQIIDHLSEQGCQVITNKDKTVHASGHAGRDDLKILYKHFRPTDAIPIHGNSYFLVRHIDFIKESFPQTKPHLIYNHSSVHISTQEVRVETGVPLPPIAIYGRGLPFEKEKITERRKLAHNGLVSVAISWDFLLQGTLKYTYELMGLPDAVHQNDKEFNAFLHNRIAKLSSANLHKRGGGGSGGDRRGGKSERRRQGNGVGEGKEEQEEDPSEKLKRELKTAIRKYFDPFLGHRPVTIVNIIK